MNLQKFEDYWEKLANEIYITGLMRDSIPEGNKKDILNFIYDVIGLYEIFKMEDILAGNCPPDLEHYTGDIEEELE